MKRVALYIASFWLLFSISLIYHMPMSFVVKQLPAMPEVKITGIQGTVWQGSAQSVMAKTTPRTYTDVGEVSWSFNWSQLLSGRAEYAIKFGKGSQLALHGTGLLGYEMSGAYVEDMIASMPAGKIQGYIPSPVPLAIDGQLELVVKQAKLTANGCSEGEGSIAWVNSQVGTPIGALEFGPVIADLLCQQGELSVDGGQNNAQTESEFTASLNPNGSYQTSAWFKPKAEFPQSMQSQLKWLGTPNSKGQYEFTFSGRL